MPRRSSRPLICFAAHERNRTNFNCLRTVARDGRAKSSRQAEGSISESIFQPKAARNFRVLSRSGYPLIPRFSSFFHLTLTSALYAQRRPNVVPPFVRGSLGIGFSNAITDQEGNRRTRDNIGVLSSIFSPSDRYLSGQHLSTNRWTA
jgi:hypothetical protein